MMSCFEGLLEYYKVTGEKKYLAAVENFVDMVVKTDYTIIGCSGCTHELFDNSTEKQTEETDGVMQETCVTVTFMKLAAKLFLLTGKAKYAEIIERSGLNALFGAVNDENQTMKKRKAENGSATTLFLSNTNRSHSIVTVRLRKVKEEEGLQVSENCRTVDRMAVARLSAVQERLFSVFRQ